MNSGNNKQHSDEYMVDKAKRSFLRMVSPDEFGSAATKHQDSPALVNLPPELARRDAAYLRAVELIQTAFSSPDEHKRRMVYLLAESFLEFAVNRTEQLYQISGSFTLKEPLEDLNFLKYLRLLRQMVGTLGDLTEFQQFVNGGDVQIAEILALLGIPSGNTSSFASSEVAIYNFLKLLLAKSVGPFEINRSRTRNMLSKSSLERYDRCFAMAQEFCKSLKPFDPESFKYIKKL
ncbi:MAG: hypothetical protein IKA79_08755 [Lentisphaeria bacterium]|nr:hypothetical protein [Lentisphaeria bacterium]